MKCEKIAVFICFSIVTHVTSDLNSFFLNLKVGKSTHKKIKPEDVKVNFSNVAGCDEAKKEIVEFVDFLQSPEVRLFHYVDASFLILIRRSGRSFPSYSSHFIYLLIVPFVAIHQTRGKTSKGSTALWASWYG
jgi:hypothetical protein